MLIRSGARVALLAMLIPWSFRAARTRLARAPMKARPPIPVTTQVIQLSAWSDTLQAIGTAKARESVTLTSKVSEVVQTCTSKAGARCAPARR